MQGSELFFGVKVFQIFSIVKYMPFIDFIFTEPQHIRMENPKKLYESSNSFHIPLFQLKNLKANKLINLPKATYVFDIYCVHICWPNINKYDILTYKNV